MSEVLRMKRAYMDMMQFENDKKETMKKKEEWRKITQNQKNRTVLNKFAQAENIRLEQKGKKQAKFMDKYIKQLDIKQGRQDKLAQVTSKFAGMRQRISDLERTE